MKKWFTLIEIMIVLWILGVMTAMTMSFGWNRIQQLRYQSAKSLFEDSFEQLRSHALTSSFHNKQKFKHFSIQLNKQSNSLVYTYDNQQYQKIIDPDMSLESLHIDWVDKELDSIILDMSPYTLACHFRDYEKFHTLRFELWIKNHTNKYCFVINDNNCRIVDMACPDTF